MLADLNILLSFDLGRNSPILIVRCCTIKRHANIHHIFTREPTSSVCIPMLMLGKIIHYKYTRNLFLIKKVRNVFTVRAMLAQCLFVCLSTRLSVTSRSCTKMAKPRITLTTPYDSPEILVWSKYQRHHPQPGRQIELR